MDHLLAMIERAENPKAVVEAYQEMKRIEVDGPEDVHIDPQAVRSASVVSIDSDVVTLKGAHHNELDQEIKFKNEEEAREFYEDIVEEKEDLQSRASQCQCGQGRL
jgi:hypothetical protein